MWSVGVLTYVLLSGQMSFLNFSIFTDGLQDKTKLQVRLPTNNLPVDFVVRIILKDLYFYPENITPSKIIFCPRPRYSLLMHHGLIFYGQIVPGRDTRRDGTCGVGSCRNGPYQYPNVFRIPLFCVVTDILFPIFILSFLFLPVNFPPSSLFFFYTALRSSPMTLATNVDRFFVWKSLINCKIKSECLLFKIILTGVNLCWSPAWNCKYLNQLITCRKINYWTFFYTPRVLREPLDYFKIFLKLHA